MKIKEAYSILELEETATPEDAKKQFRKMSKKLHPDNKETGDEAKFKKINEAYQIISDPQKAEREDLHWNQRPAESWGNPFGRSKIYFTTPANTRIIISFAESVLGCQKEIKLTRQIKCNSCNGEGHISINNGCSVCGGSGRTVNRQGTMVFVTTCGKCGGRAQTETCKTCQSKGVVEADSTFQANIPGGVSNGDVLVLRGVGNFVGSFGGVVDQYSDAHLTVQVIPEPGLSLEGDSVVATIEISLAEALTGCKKIVNTIKGYQDIEVNPMSRHKDEVIIPHLGVNGSGNQRIILDVKYPEDVSKILDLLNGSLNYKVN